MSKILILKNLQDDSLTFFSTLNLPLLVLSSVLGYGKLCWAAAELSVPGKCGDHRRIHSDFGSYIHPSEVGVVAENRLLWVTPSLTEAFKVAIAAAYVFNVHFYSRLVYDAVGKLLVFPEEPRTGLLKRLSEDLSAVL